MLHVIKVSSETVSSIQLDRQPANAVPLILERICESVKSEADPLNLLINFASVKNFSWLRHC